jgi:hypothetical protein
MSEPYIKQINQNSEDSHQTSPHWVVTFVRFSNRDTKNYQNNNDSTRTRRALVVENDCISVNVSLSKSNYTPKATLTLLSGDLNYGTAVSPGDFFMVNIVNSSEKAREIRIRAGNSKAINRQEDGFKGVFKINTVNKIVQTDPSSGRKTLRYQVAGYGFTEFNNMIYFNPTIATSIKNKGLLYQINAELLESIGTKTNVQEILEKIPYIILGKGIDSDVDIASVVKTPYKMPGLVMDLMGYKNEDKKKGQHAIDLYKIMLGVWDNKISSSASDKDGFNPTYTESKKNSTQKTKTLLSGDIPIQNSPLTSVRLVDVISRFSNSLVNEMYNCYRIDKETNRILPKMIIRQKPFNTLHGKVKGTNFLQLARWKISPDLIYSINVSKNDNLRFNVVHIMGTTGNPKKDGALLAKQDADGTNFISDPKDIEVHGVRPYVKTCPFNWVDNTLPKYWAELCFDWVYGGHLKLNGTIDCVGIVDNICIGDNLELQNTVYHIESISHTANISANGVKSFKTSLQVTHGVDKRSSVKGPVYPEMDFTDTKTDREDDFNKGYGILPGFSDTQDVLGRDGGEELDETKELSYTPQGIKKKKINKE